MSNTDTPTALPTYANAQAWRGEDMAQRSDWIYTLTPGEAAEVDANVRRLDASGIDLLDIEPGNFPVPTLAPRLQQLRQEVLQGRGFVLMRGLLVKGYSPRQAAIAYFGMARHFGETLTQNAKGHVLGHVKDLGLDYANPMVRGYQTTARLNYHTDYADVVGLLCLKTAKSGGLSSIVSSTTLWNEMVRRWPEHARTLLEPLYYTRWNEIPAGKLPYVPTRVFSLFPAHVVANYVRSSIRKAQQAFPEIPRLTQAQTDALDAFDSIHADPQLRLEMEFRPGDIQLLNNHFIMHSRTDYEDWPEIERRRHLLRIWLACDGGPQLPDFLVNDIQEPTATGRPNGIVVPGARRCVPLEAE